MEVDNTRAITVVTKGYSKKLKSLERTQVFDRLGARIHTVWTVGGRIRADSDTPGQWFHQVLASKQFPGGLEDDVYDHHMIERCLNSFNSFNDILK